MIPYDDLVAALSTWRARQGLPVSTMGGSGSGPNPGSGPHGRSGSGPNAASSSYPGMGAAAMHDEPLDDAAILDEDSYENEGNDFAVGFGGGGNEVEPTAIGDAPERPTENDIGGGGRDDW